MRLPDAVSLIPDFGRWNHADKIKYFAWYLHTYRGWEHFSANDIRDCFQELGIPAPASINPFIGVMEKRTPKEVIKTAKGYKLEKQLRAALDARYGNREATVRLPNTVSQLVSKVADRQARALLDEIVTCFKYQAFRAVIALSWSAAYAHLVQWIQSDPARLGPFNACFDAPADFVRLREDQVLEAAGKARVISAPMRRLMTEKFEFCQATLISPASNVSRSAAEGYLTQLLRNVILELE